MERVMEQDEASRLAGENPKADETAGVDLEEMTKKELVAYGETISVTLEIKQRKTDMIAELEAASSATRVTKPAAGSIKLSSHLITTTQLHARGIVK